MLDREYIEWVKQHREHLSLLAVVLLAGLLRLFSLGRESLWLDEATTWFVAQKPLGEIAGIMSAGEFNPPLFYLLEHGILTIGQSEFVLRLIPAICGIALIPVIYWISNEIGTPRTALASSLVASVSPGLIYYSQEARAYVPSVLLVALAMLLYLRIRTDPRIPYQIAFGITSATAFWLHFWAALPVGILLLHDLLTRRTIDRFLPGALFLMASSPIFLAFWNLVPLRTGIGATFGYRGITLVYPTLAQFFSQNVFSVFLFLALAGAGFLFLRDRTTAGMFLAVLLVPTTITVFASTFVPMMPRYLLFLSVPLFCGIGQVAERIPSRWWAYLLIGFLVLLMIPPLYGYFTTPQKDDWRGVASAVSNLTQGQENVILIPNYNIHPFSYYYSPEADGTYLCTPGNLSELTAIQAHFCQSCRKRPSAYYVLTGDVYSIPEGQQMLGWLKNNTHQKTQVGNVVILEGNV